MKSAGKARSNGLYRHIRTSKEIIRNLLNYYRNVNGNSEAIFLITQYYVNGFTATDKDLATIRLGGEYKIKNDQLIVGNNSNPLPKNWRDRSEKYDKAYEIFGK